VGRDHELIVLREHAAEASAEHTQFVLVEGEPGVGKSALVRHFVAGLAPTHVIRAGGDQSELLHAYGVVDQLARSAGPDALSGLPLLSAPLTGALDPMAVGAELVGLFGNLQVDGASIVVVVDDLQWIDLPSSQALLFAFRRLQRDRLLGIVMARSGELTRLGEGWASMLWGDHRSGRLRLGGMTQTDASALAFSLGVRDLSTAALQRLVDHTGGNHLHVRALLEELQIADINDMVADLPAPRALAGIVFTRVAALSPLARDFVLAAAVLGLQCPVSQAASVAEIEDPSPTLQEIEDAGLMRETLHAGRRRTTFNHALIQRAIYDDLGPNTRRDLHRRAAAVTDGSTQLFHRIRASVGPDGTLAHDLEVAATVAVADSAPALAVSWLISAADCSPASSDRERLLLDAFRLATNTSDLATAFTLKPAIEEGTPTPRRSALLGHFAFITGQFPLAERLLAEAWERARPPAEANYGAQGASSMATYLLVRGRSVEAVEWGKRAADMIEDDKPLERQIRNFRALNLILAGSAEEGMGLLSALPAIPAEFPEEETSALVFRGVARLFLDDIAGARRDLSVASVRHRSGLTFNFDTHGLTFLVDAEYRAGAWDEAAVHAELAVSLAHDADRIWDFGFVHAHAALVPAGRGEWEVAAAHVDEAWAWSEGFGVGLALAMTVTSKALALAAQRDWTGVLSTTEAVRSFGQLDSLGRPGAQNWRPLELEALIVEGERAQARVALQEFEQAAAPANLLSSSVDLWRLRGLLAEAEGDMARADQAFAEARRLAPGLPASLQKALFELADGHRAIRRDAPAEARRSLLEARQGLTALKATPYIEHCDKALKEVGVVSDGVGVGPSFILTPTELVVAKLVAGGRSNREVASELYVSVKAIEFHMSNIFAKLGIRSRRDIAGVLGPSAQI
jgi:DNA-binding CsgD family transcriptional regulator/tetratricopeptide (TPR) repeat protein